MATHVFVVVTTGLKSVIIKSISSRHFFAKVRNVTIDFNEIRVFLNDQKKNNFLYFLWYLIATTVLNINKDDLKI